MSFRDWTPPAKMAAMFGFSFVVALGVTLILGNTFLVGIVQGVVVGAAALSVWGGTIPSR